MQTVGVLEPESERLADLGIRVGAGREVPVGSFLFFHDGDVGKAGLPQNAGDGLQPGTVQGSIDDRDVAVDPVAVKDALALDRFEKRRDAILCDILDLTFRFEGVEITAQNVAEDVEALDLGQDRRRPLGRDLASVGSVDLVAVVL